MGERFSLDDSGRIEVGLFPSERKLLKEVVAASDSALRVDDDMSSEDPGRKRLHVPVYLGDEAASDEWWRLMGDHLRSARDDDRAVFEEVVGQGPPVVIDGATAEGFLRVVNSARLVFAARLGIEVEDDFGSLSVTDETVLWFLSFVVDDLSAELARMLPAPTEDDRDE